MLCRHPEREGDDQHEEPVERDSQKCSLVHLALLSIYTNRVKKLMDGQSGSAPFVGRRECPRLDTMRSAPFSTSLG